MSSRRKVLICGHHVNEHGAPIGLINSLFRGLDNENDDSSDDAEDNAGAPDRPLAPLLPQITPRPPAFRYDGELKDGVYHGYGRYYMYHANKYYLVYAGTFFKGKYSGIGKYYVIYNDKHVCAYYGRWRNGVPKYAFCLKYVVNHYNTLYLLPNGDIKIRFFIGGQPVMILSGHVVRNQLKIGHIIFITDHELIEWYGQLSGNLAIDGFGKLYSPRHNLFGQFYQDCNTIIHKL